LSHIQLHFILDLACPPESQILRLGKGSADEMPVGY
jgi:hypothetical protein